MLTLEGRKALRSEKCEGDLGERGLLQCWIIPVVDVQKALVQPLTIFFSPKFSQFVLLKRVCFSIFGNGFAEGSYVPTHHFFVVSGSLGLYSP